MLDRQNLVALMKQVAKANPSAPVAYSWNGQNLSYEALQETLRNELNELAEQLEELEEDAQKAIQAMLLDGYSFNEALEKANNGDYTMFYDCDNMTDVAYEVVEMCGYLNNVPEQVARYFDYEAFGRDLGIEGKFYNIDGDMVEIY